MLFFFRSDLLKYPILQSKIKLKMYMVFTTIFLFVHITSHPVICNSIQSSKKRVSVKCVPMMTQQPESFPIHFTLIFVRHINLYLLQFGIRLLSFVICILYGKLVKLDEFSLDFGRKVVNQSIHSINTYIYMFRFFIQVFFWKDEHN